MKTLEIGLPALPTCDFSLSGTEAVPKRILELMNVPGLTRENVASHLQVCKTFFKDISQPHCFYIQLLFHTFINKCDLRRNLGCT